MVLYEPWAWSPSRTPWFPSTHAGATVWLLTLHGLTPSASSSGRRTTSMVAWPWNFERQHGRPRMNRADGGFWSRPGTYSVLQKTAFTAGPLAHHRRAALPEDGALIRAR